jgi:serine phosphatase RsbU (regulator of sigma subunit)/anti-anti-sigma regulatory factor
VPFAPLSESAVAEPDPEPAAASLLVVDDDEDFRRLLVSALAGGEPCRIEEAASADEARLRLSQRPYDVVITDLSMPGEGGLSLLRWSQQHCPGAQWIVLTGHATFDAAVAALKLGAFDFLSKPLPGVEPLRKAVRNALAQRRLQAERDRLHAELRESNERLREHVEQLQRACLLLREQAESVRADLHRAAIIQQALLPRAAPKLERFQVHAFYRPSQHVGGDLYDVVRLDDRRWVLLIADAAGHGLSAAMLAVLFRSQIPFVDPDSRVACAPREALRAVNRSLCEALPARGLFLTAVYCLLDVESGSARIASAGHPPLLWLRSRGGVEQVYHGGPALGLHPEADFAEQELALERGDRLLFYSDGLYDRFPDEGGPPAGRLAAALAGGGDCADALLRLVGPARGAEAEVADDVTVLLLSATAGRSRLDNGAPRPPPAPPAQGRSSRILIGTSAGRTVLCIEGKPDWAQSAAFHGECAAAIDAGRDLMIDLALCPRLDSTFLGTIHDLAERADRAGVELRLQGVTPWLEELFAELGMERVRDHVVPRMLPLPTRMTPLAEAAPDGGAQALQLLRAHEVLAALSERNRREFDPLLAALRREIPAPPAE